MIFGIIIGIGISVLFAFLLDQFVFGGNGRALLKFMFFYYLDKFFNGGNPMG